MKSSKDHAVRSSRPAVEPAGTPGSKEQGTGSEPGWTLLSASVVGRSHIASGRKNEDAAGTALLADGSVLLAVADGAGSASRSGEGARLAVDAALAALSALAPTPEQYDRESLLAVLRAVRRSLAQHARVHRIRPRQLACTLLLVLIKDELVTALQVGDGAIVVRDEGGWRRLTQPLRGHFAGETVFVTSRQAARLAQSQGRSLAEVEAIALLSDGLEPVATDVSSGAPFGPFFDPLVKFGRGEGSRPEKEAELERFLSSERVQSRSSDDLSLVLAIRR